MHSNNCLNCDALPKPGDNFCSNCSQAADTHKLTVSHIVHETFHAFTHADRGILYLVKGLASRPGVVVKEYILGKRKKYYNPFTFLLICLGLFVFMNSVFHPFLQETSFDPNVIAHLPPEQAAQYKAKMHRVANLTKVTEKHSNILGMISTPFLAAIYFLCFYKRKINFAEHLTTNVFFHGFYSIVTTFMLIPIIGYSKGTSWYPLAFLSNFLLHALYFSWGYQHLLNLQGVVGFIRLFLVSMLGILFWSIITGGAAILYLKYG